MNIELINEKDVLLIGKNIINRVCCICSTNETYINKLGINQWHNCKCNRKDCTGYLCNKCNSKKLYYIPGGQQDIIKKTTQCRKGSLDRFSNNGRSFIGQWIAAKTLDLKDLNIENNNFREAIDLSYHPIYRRPDVKTATFRNIYKWWNITIENYNFDTLIALCTDRYEIWRSVKRVYIIPVKENPSRGRKYEDFRVDERIFNDTYHSVDIPRFYSPFDLWIGKYDKVI